MKKIISSLLIVIITFLISLNVYALTPEEIHSNEALLVNMNTDEVLFSKNTNNDKVPIASLTKLMTYAVVIDEIPDLENTRIVVPNGLVQDMKNIGASRAGLIDGYEYSALDLLYGMMLPSGCDAAETLARYIGGGDPAVFVEKMRAKAQSIGLTNSYFIDAHGVGVIGDDNYSTEQDIYTLAKYDYYLPYFQQIISTEYYNITAVNGEETLTNTVRNTNYLMGEYSGAEYYNPYSIGGKTGNLDVAGKCLVTFAQKGDLLVVAITLGVQNEYGSNYDYNFTDNNKLLDYAFSEHTENITIDVGPEYRSVEIGKQHKIEATTSANTQINWTSEDPSVATVDQNGIVTGISEGQTKIIATTQTGNLDYTYVSVNFYNGLHTKFSTGLPYGPNNWSPIDYSVVKSRGIDYVIIRAGYGENTKDKTFENNIENAIENELNIGIWYEGYAESIESAEKEANNLVSILNNLEASKISNLKEKINLPILYNLLYSETTDPDLLLNMVITFKNILNNNGYENIMLELERTRLTTLDLNQLKDNNIDFSIVERVFLPNFKEENQVNGINASIWNYKSSAYQGPLIGRNGQLSLMYMNYKKIPTIHKEYIEEEQVIEDSNETTQLKVINRKHSNKNCNEISTVKTISTGNKLDTKSLLNKDNKLIKDKDNKTIKKEKHKSNIWLIILLIIVGSGIIYLFIRIDNE